MKLTIELPESLCRRLLSLSPPLDVSAVCASALEEALYRRVNSCRMETMEPLQETKQRAKPGPKAAVKSESVGIYLPTDLADWLRSQMKGPRDLSNVVTSLLQKARIAGFTAHDSDDTT